MINKITSINSLILFIIFLIYCGCTPTSPSLPDTSKTNPTIPTIDYDQKLSDLNINLEKPTVPVANYVHIVQTGNLLFLAGKGPKMPDGNYVTGKLGRDLTEEEGYAAARQVGVLQLAVLKDHLGDLNKIKRIVKVLGMVNATEDFKNHPEVINGFSDFMVEVFGERGKHARAAVGMGSLPRGIAVEIEVVVEVY